MTTDMAALYEKRLNRYLTAMDLGKPDKVPMRLMLDAFMAKYAGYTLQEVYYDPQKNIDALGKTAQDFDIDVIGAYTSIWWAALHDSIGADYYEFAGYKLEENRQFQYFEDEYMKADEYDLFIENPTEYIMNHILPRLCTEFDEPGSYRSNIALVKGAAALFNYLGQLGQAGAMYKEKYGLPLGSTGIAKAPFDTLGDVPRSLKGIMMDMHNQPDKLEAALETIVPHNIFYGMATAQGDTTFPLFMPLHRGSYPFLSPRNWDKFYWPTLKKVVEELWKLGKRTWFYAEGNWTPYLEKIAELPEKSIVFHCDLTEIEEAHKVLKGKFCISGNVPNTLLSYGKPAEVSDYVKMIIDKYAADGGFLIDTAGVLFADAKVENVRALVDTVNKYGVY
jgi:hypothetical protein